MIDIYKGGWKNTYKTYDSKRHIITYHMSAFQNYKDILKIFSSGTVAIRCTLTSR